MRDVLRDFITNAALCQSHVAVNCVLYYLPASICICKRSTNRLTARRARRVTMASTCARTALASHSVTSYAHRRLHSRASRGRHVTSVKATSDDTTRFGILNGSSVTYARGGDATYTDGVLDAAAITLFNAKLAQVVGKDTAKSATRGAKTPFDALVSLADALSVGRTVDEQRDAVTRALLSLIPSPVRFAFKKLIKPANWVDEMNATVTREAFAWLVGPCEIVPRESDGVMASVKLQKFRYLEQCGCTASCTNFCKIPTQRFFKEAFGVDARLDPNHEDGSCMMTFGVAPAVNDPAFDAPCYTTCAKGKCDGGAPCHRLGEPPKGL